MDKKTGYIIIGIGTASILAGIYAAFRSAEWIDALSGTVIGLSLIGTAIVERTKKGNPE